jgi:hypothetical protein
MLVLPGETLAQYFSPPDGAAIRLFNSLAPEAGQQKLLRRPNHGATRGCHC